MRESNPVIWCFKALIHMEFFFHVDSAPAISPIILTTTWCNGARIYETISGVVHRIPAIRIDRTASSQIGSRPFRPPQEHGSCPSPLPPSLPFLGGRTHADALEHIDQVGVGIDLVQPARHQHTLDDADALCTDLARSEQLSVLTVTDGSTLG